MPEKDRKYEVLRALIREYIRSAEPVGSQTLRESRDFSWSPATIRNDLAELEQEGYLAKPHPSGGRVPTDKAYRHYVNELLTERETLEKRFSGRLQALDEEIEDIASPDQLMQAAAKLLARFTRHLALGGIPGRARLYESGLAELIGEPEFSRQEQVIALTRFVEDFADNVVHLTKKLLRKELELYIGRENLLPTIRSCSLLMSDFRLPNGEQGFFAILGPTRMHYDRNIAFLQRLTRTISELSE